MSKGASVSDSEIRLALDGLIVLLQENDQATVLIRLFAYHKTYLEFWVLLTEALLRRASTHRQFSIINSLITASSKNSLSESTVLFPGLYSIVTGTKNDSIY